MPEVWVNAITIFLAAFIGYFTNLVAIKMLFRPYTKKRIWKIPILFTPGIIPKNRYKISASIAEMISKDILDENELSENLLNNIISEGKVEDLLEKNNLENIASASKEKLIDSLSNDIILKFEEGNISEVIVEKMLEGIKPKLGFFGGMVDGFSPLISEKIDEYVHNNAHQLIKKYVDSKYEELLKMDSKAIKESVVFEAIKPFIGDIINKIDLNSAIKNGIDKLDIKTFEKMLIKILKKELRAITYFGAILGALIGLFTLFV